MTTGRPKGTIKTGGRRKGTPNRLTASLRQKIGEFVEGKLDELEGMWEQEMDVKEKLQLLRDLLKMILPPPRDPGEEVEDTEESVDPLRELIESLKK